MEEDGTAGTTDAAVERLGLGSRAADQRYNDLFEQAALGIVVSTPAGTVIVCNPGFARMLGFRSVDDAVGTSMRDLYETPADRDRFVAELREKTRLESYRVRLRRRDGRPIEVLTNVVGSYDATGTLVELRGYLIDVTAIVEAESAVRVREQLFRAVFFGASDAMMLLDDRRAIVDANPAASELFGKALAELTGETLDSLFLDDGESMAAAWQEFIALGEAKQEHPVRASATPRLFECSYRARVQPGRHLCIARDVTDRRLVEQRLAQAARIESVGRLAGGIAHDFNNLLTAILGYTELLLARRGPGDPERADLEQIHNAGRRATTLTQQLLAFGRQQVLQPREVDLNLAIGGLKPMLRRVLREDITLVIKLARAPTLVTIDPDQIEQAVLNLILNARDAVPMGGVIRLDLRHVTLSPDRMPSERRAAAGPYVRLRVIDNGTGLTPEVRAHLFEPFFTTKDVGKGTGLGLASVYGIVHQSGGFIAVDSPPSGGTIFTLYLPVTGVRRPEPDQPAAFGRETVLLVEDEDAVRVVIGALLGRHGYQVIEAPTPQSALEMFPRQADAIDLLLTDIVMPGMNGPALAQRLVAAKPGLRILFISGYADAATSALSGPNISFLAKPFRAEALTRKVRELLDRPARKPPS